MFFEQVLFVRGIVKVFRLRSKRLLPHINMEKRSVVSRQNYTIILYTLNISKLYLCGQIPCMSKKIKPYKDSTHGKKEQVKQMFDTISKDYDGLNRVISLGLDLKWRRRVVALVKKQSPKTILDIATGTGDLAIALTKTGAKKIVGLDISPGMLEVGRAKILQKKLHETIDMVLGDSEVLSFSDNSFDAVTVAFGVRNFENLENGLQEIHRVLKPDGRLVVLETAVPTKTPYKQAYKLYTKYVLPNIGKIFSKDRSAYTYLGESASVFPYGKKFNNILDKIGFIGIENMPQTFGAASIYSATK